MKKQILKIAGVKSEKEFYKKFPDEASFMKAHGKAFKKAQIGTYMTSQAEMPVYSPADVRGMYDELEYQLTGMTSYDREKLEALGGVADQYGIDPTVLQAASEELFTKPQTLSEEVVPPPAKRGRKIKKAQTGIDIEPKIENYPDYNSWKSDWDAWDQGRMSSTGATGGGTPTTTLYAPSTSTSTTAAPIGAKTPTDKTGMFVQSGVDVIQGLSMIKQQQDAVKEAKQMSALTNAMGLAAASVPAQLNRRQYVRPEDVVIQPEQMFPSYGVGTNVLAEFGASVGGGEIANTFAPNTLYDNLGYEPLNDSERYKQFYHGGKLHKAEGGFDFTNFMNNQGGNALAGTLGNVITGSEVEAGNKIGKGIGTAAGTAIGGPIGGAIGGLLGGAVGGIIDRSEEKIKKYQAESKRNMGDIMGRNFGMGIQSQFASYMEDGGVTKAEEGTSVENCPPGFEYSESDGDCVPVNRTGIRPPMPTLDGMGDIRFGGIGSPLSLGFNVGQPNRFNIEGGYRGMIDKDKLGSSAYNLAFNFPKIFGKDRALSVTGDYDRNNLRLRTSATLPLFGGTLGIKGGYDQNFGKPQEQTNADFMRVEPPSKKGKANASLEWNKKIGKTNVKLSGSYGRPSMEDGGQTSDYQWVSHTWQPQVIASFGGRNLKDLLKPPHDAEMLRAGGHLKAYTPPSAAAMSTERPVMQMGGELQTHWGGYAEPMSYNPYLPDGGETVMFRGQSHDESDGRGNTGIGITYGENPVEVERGEPAMKLKDGSSPDSNLVVFGNLKIPKSYLPFLGNDAKGKKFKTYVADLSKKENNQNKKIDNATKMLEDLEVSTPIDRMTLNSLQYTMLGANSKLKEIADKKMAAASLQNAINDTAEEMGIVADDLARGKVKIDKEAFKDTAQGGKKLKKVKALPNVPAGQQKGDVFYGNVTQADFEAMMARNPWYDWENFDPSSDADVRDFQKAFNREAKKLGVDTRLQVDGDFGEQTVSAESLYGESKPIPTIPGGTLNISRLQELPQQAPTAAQIPPITPYKRNTLVDVLGQVVPYLRPSDSESLNPMQLMGEMYALSNNQVEPVQAQTVQPQLSSPYDISLQDILNENEATYRSQQRMVGYNPAIQGQLSAQKYAANQKVLAEQFRLNQAKRDQVYGENRNLLNQFGLQKLNIFDRQYVRQAEALSKTKATTQAALNSISDKFLRNRLENRTLATMENLYNYRYDPRFRAINMNAPFQPQIPTVYTGPDGKQYQVVGNGAPSMATPGIVPTGRVPAAAPGAPAVTQVPPPGGAEPAPGTIGPPPADFTPIAPTSIRPAQPVQPAPIDFEEEVLTEDELKGYGKKGIKVSKKKRLNSSIVRAFKNL
jgi:hypothetical protein